MVTEKETRNGFPIYIQLVAGKNRFKKCIFHSKNEDWDIINNIPLKHHPDYFLILPEALEYHSKIKKINFGSYSFYEAKKLLVNGEIEIVNHTFISLGLKLCNNTTNGKLYRTVLNSFNAIYPNVMVNDITQQMAKRYMSALLVKNKPNGVHTYLRTLNAIFNKVSDLKNPFTGVRPRKIKTAKKPLTDIDLIKLRTTTTYLSKFDKHNTVDSINHYKYYWFLMFYLGGINFIDLANLRYDKHVVNGRIQFYRHKGGTNVFINNKIFPRAKQLLNKFDCYPYLVPIYKYSNYESARENLKNRFIDRIQDLELTKPPVTVSARSTFINRARQLMVDERVCIEIVGHEQQKTHSIYPDEYPLHVRDAAHLKIIGF